MCVCNVPCHTYYINMYMYIVHVYVHVTDVLEPIMAHSFTHLPLLAQRVFCFMYRDTSANYATSGSEGTANCIYRLLLAQKGTL